ncbi:MAG: hypothetical protein ACLVHS_12500 [Blautia wexlerae]
MMLFKKFTNENASEKVTVKERLAYGCGDFSSNIMYSAMAAFLLFCYTDVVGSKCLRQKVSLRNL